MSGRIVVVGDVMTDIIVVPEGPIVVGSDRRSSIRSRPGGSGANQAVWLASAGADVSFAARVGSADRAGYETHFRERGVASVLAGDKDMQSGMLVTIIDADGERSFLTDRGANLNLGIDDLPDSLLEGAAMVLVSGYSFFAPGPRKAVRNLLERARARGLAVAIDPASVGFLHEVGPTQFLDWVGPADWIFANESEAETLTGAADFEGHVQALGQQFGHVVIKRGRFGAVVGDRTGVVLSRAAPLVRMVDSTGAGDAFAAGFLAALLKGESVEDCLDQGIANGARAVQFVGGQPQ